jgi:hypothetical protein
MARNEKPPEDKGKVKFRFVEFEMEGGSSNLEETIKSIAHAITRGSQVPTRLIGPFKPPAGSLSGPAANGNGAGNTDLDVEPEPVEDETRATQELSDDSRAPEKVPKERRYRQAKFLDELDLDSDPSFRSFVEEYTPHSDLQKYLVIAAWYKLHRDTPGLGADQAFTCYRKMRWTEQKDPSQPFRDLKRKDFFKSSKNGIWEITQLGIDELQRIKTKATA